MIDQVRPIVYLVGAGPGDPGLITVRGMQLLQRAEVILHDRLVTPELLAFARDDAELVCVAGLARDATIRQQRIADLLIAHARNGRLVIRLKGGDPYVFGRGFEELCACREAGVDCVVVPGVSSAIAGPAAAGIPLTDRHLVRTVAFVTGRTAPESDAPPVDFAALASIDTLVVLMGRERLGEIAAALISSGKDPATPAACVEWATTPRQRVTVATLGTIAEAAANEGISAPTVIVVGPVAALADAAAGLASSFASTDWAARIER